MIRSMRSLLVFGALVGAACGKLPSGTATLGQPCTRNADCAVPYVCIDSACAVDLSRACNPGDLRCNGEAVERCKSDGTGWSLQETCATGCSEGACNKPVCAAGDARCDAGIVFACLADGSAWTYDHACPGACDTAGKDCAAPVCAPYATKCDPDPNKVTSVETCDARGASWVETTCPQAPGVTAVCDQGQCRPRICITVGTGSSATRDSTCDGDVLLACNDAGTAFEPVEVCPYGCAATSATQAKCAPAACTAGDRACQGNEVEQCATDERGYELVQYCPAGCASSAPGQAECTPPSCQAGALTCAVDAQSGLSYVQQCTSDGTSEQVLETCSQTCIAGQCVTDNANCAPGDTRCHGVETQVCVQVASDPTPTTQWVFSEHCLGSCQGGVCDGAGACGCTAPSTAGNVCGSTTNPAVTLELGVPAGTSLPADGLSTFLVYTGPITDSTGTQVPDGTMVTFTESDTGSLLASQDADLELPGLQRPTQDGQARVVVRAPGSPATVTVSAGVGGSCTGSVRLSFVAAPPPGSPHTAWVAEDFSTYAHFDRVDSSGTWDTTSGAAIGSPVYSFGTGADGDFTASAGTGGDNLWTEGLAKGWRVTAIGAQSVRTIGYQGGLSPGDEVLLINVSDTKLPDGSAPTIGVYEFKRVAQPVENGVVAFTTPVERGYGLNGNQNLQPSTEVVFVQRVPQFRDVTIQGSVSSSGFDPINDTGSGVLAFRATGTVDVSGALAMDDKGLLPQSAQCGAGSCPAQYVTQAGSNSNTFDKLLLGGGGQQQTGGGILFVAAKKIDVHMPSGTISASTSDGNGGDLWLQAGAMVADSGAPIVAVGTGGTSKSQGKVRLDFGSGSAITTTPSPYIGENGAFVVETLPVYDEPTVTNGTQLLVHRIELAKVIGGEGSISAGLPTAMPGVHIDAANTDSGQYASWFSLDAGGWVPTQQGLRMVRFRARLETSTDQPTQVLGVQLGVDAS